MLYASLCSKHTSSTIDNCCTGFLEERGFGESGFIIHSFLCTENDMHHCQRTKDGWRNGYTSGRSILLCISDRSQDRWLKGVNHKLFQQNVATAVHKLWIRWLICQCYFDDPGNMNFFWGPNTASLSKDPILPCPYLYSWTILTAHLHLYAYWYVLIMAIVNFHS